MMEISLNTCNKGTANLLDMICLYAWVAGESGTSVRKDFPSSQHLPEEEKMHKPSSAVPLHILSVKLVIYIGGYAALLRSTKVNFF